MPNLKGGKKYKAGKHSNTKAEFHEIGEGQMVARVLKHLGDRNVLVYCNDGKERIAHIRGGLSKKKACIETGDIVLISLRGKELETDTKKEIDNKKVDRGDILAKYDHEIWGQLKKMETINKNLFIQLEIMDRTKVKDLKETVDEGFEFEDAEELEDEESEEELDKDTMAKAHKLQEKKRNMERDIKQSNTVEEELDIDAI